MKFKNPIYRFIVTAFGIYILWFLLYDLYLKPQGSLDWWLSYIQTKISTFLLNLIGYDCVHVINAHTNHIYQHGRRVIQVAHSCNGQVLYPLFAGFIICTPGKLKDKVIYILIGSIGIFISNVIRICALGITKIEAPEYLHFNHHYTFTILIYSFIFLLWIIWIKRNNNKKDQPPTQ